MELLHLFLIKAASLQEAWSQVTKFIKEYDLVSYDRVELVEKRSFCAKDPRFLEFLEKGINKNRVVLEELIKELTIEGYETLSDLSSLPQGYLSKQLHTLAHFLDGFFGIDSYFYNLIENSHWVSSSLMKSVKSDPLRYWLICAKVFLLD